MYPTLVKLNCGLFSSPLEVWRIKTPPIFTPKCCPHPRNWYSLAFHVLSGMKAVHIAVHIAVLIAQSYCYILQYILLNHNTPKSTGQILQNRARLRRATLNTSHKTSPQNSFLPENCDFRDVSLNISPTRTS